MTRRISRKSNIGANFKDYIVPIIGGILLLILLYSFFNGNNNNELSQNNNENRTPTEISFIDNNTEAFISYAGSNKDEKITESNSFYKGETITIKEGSVSLSSPEGNKIHLAKVAELKYEEDGSYSFYSSDAWFDLSSDTNISMKFVNLQANAGSILSITQNEAGSTIYILRGGAKVTNLAGISTLLVAGQKISISRLNAANEDLDIENEKSPIDSYFKGSDWFLENNGNLILQDTLVNSKADSGNGVKTIDPKSGIYISFDTLRDEMSVQENSLNISGQILSSEVSSVTINNKQVAISSETQSFVLNNLAINQTINDLVIKIYNAQKNIIQKKVYTVYTSAKSNTLSDSVSRSQKVTTYSVDATDFGFTEPSSVGKFATSSSEITIRGYTNAENITRVEVNGFKLASFNGNTWRYHAFKRFETLEEGTNQYRIDYFGEDDSLVYTDYYIIVKKDTAIIPISTKKENTDEKIISNEA